MIIDVLVVGGGGQGGASYGGGGGAGGVVIDTGREVGAGEYPVVIGAGGSGSSKAGNNGDNSTFDDITAVGGGGGGWGNNEVGKNGGSGGGGGGYAFTSGGTGTQADSGGGTGYGENGGTGRSNPDRESGGGGGASAVGANGGVNVSGNGGAGVASSISGASVTYAGGGGGGADGDAGDSAGSGGAGGGGNGSSTGVGSAGTANSGGGGGGGDFGFAGGAGGSGIVIIRYLTTDFGDCTGGTITTDGDYTIHTFTSSGTFSVPGIELSDSVSISESVSNLTTIKLADSISFSESLDAHFFLPLNLSDNLSITSSVANKAYHRTSDSISFAESLKTEPTYLSLFDSLEVDAGMEISLTEVYSGGEKSDWNLKIKNPTTGKFIASLTNARKRWFVERLDDETEAGFIIDAEDINATETILNLGINELYIYYQGNLKWSGQLASAKKIAKGNDIYWEVLAKDWVALLGKRFCGVEELREFTTTDAGQIAKTLIQETQALANGSFGITYGTIEVSITRSPIYDKKNILEAIKELSNMGDDGSANYGFDFEITPSKVFNVYYPYKGTIRNEVVFRYPGNCENFEAFVDSWGIVNQEWGLGRHWTGNTAVVSRADATSQTTYKRREAIKNYKDMSVLEFLQDMVWQDIQWLKDPSTVIRFDSRVDAKTRINDYNVGDGVSVVCDKFDINEWLWIYERKVEIQDNDELLVTLTVGN